MNTDEIEALTREVFGPNFDVIVAADGRAGVEIVDEDTGEVIPHFLVSASGDVLAPDLAASLGLAEPLRELSRRLAAAYVPPPPHPLVAKVWAHPPRCVSKFELAPLSAPFEGMTHFETLAYLTLGCPCGANSMQVLGYPEDDIFLGPLAAKCDRCGAVTELMDPRIDGYNGEIAANSTRVGHGQRSAFACACGGSELEIFVGFSYQGLDEEDFEHETWARIQDFFGAFCLYGRCRRCQNLTDITDFECA